MKKILFILSFLFCAIVSFAQYPLNQSISSDSTLLTSKGGTKLRPVIFSYHDTTSANTQRISQYAFSVIVTPDGTLWVRDSTAKKWIQQTSVTNNTIYNIYNTSITNVQVINQIDSSVTVQICTGANSCDTFHFITNNIFNATATVSFIDSTHLKICGTDTTTQITTCDTFSVPAQKLYIFQNGVTQVSAGVVQAGSLTTIPVSLVNNFIDYIGGSGNSIFTMYPNGNLKASGYDSLRNDGFINRSLGVDNLGNIVVGTTIPPSNCGLISPGSLVWSGFGLKYYVTPSIYCINGITYQSRYDSVTLVADATNPTIFAIYVDTSRASDTLMGVPAPAPVDPKQNIDPNTQVYLTSITVPALATVVPIDTTIIFDKNVEWVVTNTGTTTNPANTTNVYRQPISLNVTTIRNGNIIYFTQGGSFDLTPYNAVDGFIELKQTIPNAANLSVRWYNGTTALGVAVNISFNKVLGSLARYQAWSIPLSAFQLTSNIVTQLRITYTSNNNTTNSGFYLDFIYLNNIPTTVVTSAGVQSVGLTMPAAFTVTNSPITTTGNLTVTGAGSANQYINGQGNLATFPIDTSFIKLYGSGVIPIWALGTDDTIRSATFIAGTGITITKNPDSTITFAATGGGGVNIYNSDGLTTGTRTDTLNNFSLIFHDYSTGFNFELDPQIGSRDILFNSGNGTSLEIGDDAGGFSLSSSQTSQHFQVVFDDPTDYAQFNTAKFGIGSATPAYYFEVNNGASQHYQWIDTSGGKSVFGINTDSVKIQNLGGSGIQQVWVRNNGLLFDSLASGGLLTANNGLTANTSTNVQLGGTLLGNTTIATAANTLTISSSTTDVTPLIITATGSMNYGLSVTSDNATGISGSGGNTGVYGSSPTGWAFYGVSSNVVEELQLNSQTDNDVSPSMVILANASTGLGQNGFGTSIDFQLNYDSAYFYAGTSNQIISKWTSASTSNLVSELDIMGTSASAYSGPPSTYLLASFNGNRNTTMYGLTLHYQSKSANYTLLPSDYAINFTSNADTATLPTAVGITGTIYVIKTTGVASIVATTSSQTIDGVTTYALTAAKKYVMVISDGANWEIISNN